MQKLRRGEVIDEKDFNFIYRYVVHFIIKCKLYFSQSGNFFLLKY